MRLGEIIDGVKEEWKDTEIKGVAYNSKEVKDGFLFIARKGLSDDGHKYIDEAIKNGAVAFVLERDLNIKYPKIIVDDGRKALADISCRFYSFPSKKIKLIGITGTNGKTTTSLLLKSIYEEQGLKTGLIGSIEYFIGEEKYKAERTTPEALDINRLLSLMIEKGVKVGIMEVSSHSLALDRVRGLDFNIAGLTNISRDHFDFHKDMESYINSKMRLFKGLGENNIAVLNREDNFERFRKVTKARVISYGTKECDISGEVISSNTHGTEVEIKWSGERIKIFSHLIGLHNLYNILLSFAISWGDGVPPIFIKRGIEKVNRVPGRFEVVGNRIIIDYAHTPAALEIALKSAREIAKGKVICIFGCGGNRDKGKRAIMGEVATRLADLSIITSDNPRNEEPSEIIDMIKAGARDGKYIIIEDRKSAIEKGIRESEEGDIVLIAGKGHEDYQIIGDKILPFSDKEVVEEILNSKS